MYLIAISVVGCVEVKTTANKIANRALARLLVNRLVQGEAMGMDVEVLPQIQTQDPLPLLGAKPELLQCLRR